MVAILFIFGYDEITTHPASECFAGIATVVVGIIKEGVQVPHIKDDEKKVVHETCKPKKEGELCFLFAEGALVEYNKEPRWTTIHKIKVALTNPYHTNWSHDIIQKYMTNWNKVDVMAASELAFLEFYRLVGAAYEDARIEENGNAFKTAILVPAKRKPGRPKKDETSY